MVKQQQQMNVVLIQVPVNHLQLNLQQNEQKKLKITNNSTITINNQRSPRWKGNRALLRKRLNLKQILKQ
jgi:hypothetical protein